MELNKEQDEKAYSPAADGERQLLSLDEMEKQHVIRVLQETGGHKGKTCDILGVSRPRLRRMMQNYNIQEYQDI